MDTSDQNPHIGTLTEKSLHAELKSWYARPGDRFEVSMEGLVVDLVRGDTLVEIQTGNFSALRAKLPRLLDAHPVRLVYPIAKEKWIHRQAEDGTPLGRRKSPKRGRLEDVFFQLVYIPHLLDHRHLTLEVILIQEELIYRDDGKGSWRRKGWSIHDRRLLEVVERKVFQDRCDYLSLLPAELPSPFTNRDLASALSSRISLAGKITYTLRKAGWVKVIGRRGAAYLHEIH